jgi:hypothetical protein
MGRVKPHTEGGPEPNVPMLQYIFHPLTVKTLATANVETRSKF